MDEPRVPHLVKICFFEKQIEDLNVPWGVLIRPCENCILLSLGDPFNLPENFNNKPPPTPRRAPLGPVVSPLPLGPEG